MRKMRSSGEPTRQPAEGRARDGGPAGRNGDGVLWRMELPGLKERFLECSDGPVYYCGCSAIATVNPARELFKCTACQNTTNFKKDDDPYAFKLLNQEVHSLGISMDNKTGNAMTKWQRTRNWELLVDPNLFCLSEKR
jgi:DNA-directed RNA polymerase beta subunit